MLIDTFLTKLHKSWESLKVDLISEAESSLFKKKVIKFSSPTSIPLKKQPGIYLFFIKAKRDLPFEEFVTLWKGSTPKAYSSKIKKSKLTVLKKGKWYPLYIGKSEKVLSRITEHCYQAAEKKTYGLKLRHRAEIIDVADFSVGSYELNITGSFKNYLFQFVMTNLERELRTKHQPLLGKQ